MEERTERTSPLDRESLSPAEPPPELTFFTARFQSPRQGSRGRRHHCGRFIRRHRVQLAEWDFAPRDRRACTRSRRRLHLVPSHPRIGRRFRPTRVERPSDVLRMQPHHRGQHVFASGVPPRRVLALGASSERRARNLLGQHFHLQAQLRQAGCRVFPRRGPRQRPQRIPQRYRHARSRVAARAQVRGGRSCSLACHGQALGGLREVDGSL